MCKIVTVLKAVPRSEWMAYQKGAKIQDAFVSLDAPTREQMLTGHCRDCWAALFSGYENDDD